GGAGRYGAVRGGGLGRMWTGNGCTFYLGANCSNPSNQIHEPGSGPAIPFNKLANASTPLSPVSQAMLDVWPSGGAAIGVGTNVLTINPPFSNTTNRFNPRVDVNFSQNDHLFTAVHTHYRQGNNQHSSTGP